MEYQNQPGGGQQGNLRPPMGYGPQVYSQTSQQQPYPPQPVQPQPNGYPPQQPIYYPPQEAYQPQQPAAYHQQGDFAPPTGFVPPAPPPPKPRKTAPLLKMLQALVVTVVLGAAVWYLYELLVPDATSTAKIQAGLLGARYSGDCIIVRNETPFAAEGVTSVEYDLVEEGGRIEQGKKVCHVYSSGYSTSALTSLQNYREDIRDYQKQLLDAETTYDAKMARLQNDVLNRAKEIRNMIGGARGSLSHQEDLLTKAIQDRENYFVQEYGSDQRLSRLYDDERSQLQRIESWTKTFMSTDSGIVSFYSDGYEYGLTSGNYTQFTPQEVREIYRGKRPETMQLDKGKTTIYRLVRDGSWNVLFLARDTDWNPVEGQTYELQLERFENTQVTATVESFSRSGGELLLRLSVHSSVEPVLYMRTCQAELGESVSTLMVPQRAIYRQGEMDGVVTVDDNNNESFIPVQIIWEQDGYVYINAVQHGLLEEGTTVKLY